MAITGAHVLLYSPQAEAVRTALADLLPEGNKVDAGGGWLIFALPPAKLGVHPGETAHHELSLMCDDIDATVEELRGKGVQLKGEIEDRRFGRAITVALPGDVEVLLYQPQHPTAV